MNFHNGSTSDNNWAELDFLIKKKVEEPPLLGENQTALLNNKKPDADSLVNINYFCSMSSGALDANMSSKVLSYYFSTQLTDNHLNIEVFWPNDVEEVTQLESKHNAHIAHYDGPITREDSDFYLYFGGETDRKNRVNIKDFFKILAHRKTKILFLDIRKIDYCHDTMPLKELLEPVVETAHAHGLGNVISIDTVLDPWARYQYFSSLYSTINQGFNLEDAVAKAQLALDSNADHALWDMSDSLSTRAKFLFYSKQSVNFFEDDQTTSDIGSHESQMPLPDNLFGFKSQQLPPIQNSEFDGDALALISLIERQRQSNNHNTICVSGEPGLGKTFLLHTSCLYLALKKRIDYAFYFDFSKLSYSSSDVIDMISPILIGENISGNQDLDSALNDVKCCFVFDGITQDNEGAVNEAIERLSQSGQLFLVTSQHEMFQTNNNAQMFSLSNPNDAEKKVIFRESYTTNKSTKSTEEEKILAAISQNPWLTKKVAHLHTHGELGKTEFAKLLSFKFSDHKAFNKEIYYDWQFERLDTKSKQLLILCSNVDNLLLEMPMIVLDSPKPFGAKSSLNSLLAKSDSSFADAIEQWGRCGFTYQYPHGRFIDDECKRYLKSKRDQLFCNVDSQQLSLGFSQVLCEGIRILSSSLVKQPNPAINRNIILNRRQWVSHLELLWFSKDYKGFFSTKKEFEDLLFQSSLLPESHDWSLNLLERSDFPNASSDAIDDASVPWLILGKSAFLSGNAKTSELISLAEMQWNAWLDQRFESIREDELSLFFHVTSFLQLIHESQANYIEGNNIVEKAFLISKKYRIFQRIVTSGLSLVRMFYQSGDSVSARQYEQELIEGDWWNEAPANGKQQCLLDILLVRYQVAGAEDTQSFIDTLRGSEYGEDLASALDHIQSELLDKNKKKVLH